MTAKARILRRHSLYLAAGTALCHATVGGVALAASPEEKREEHFYLSEQFTYDDNLFRAAESDDLGLIPVDPADPGATPREVSREDYVNIITVGLGNDFHMGQQTLRLKGSVYDARYQDNDYLDHTGGNASAQLDLQMLTALSGRLAGAYSRKLADPYVMFSSLARRYRSHHPDAEFTDDIIRELGRSVMVTEHRIQTEWFSWHGRTDLGFTGRIGFRLAPRTDREIRRAYTALGHFADIAGIGRGTTHGLGATTTNCGLVAGTGRRTTKISRI